MYLGLGGRVGSCGCSRIFPGPIQILNQIGNLLVETSDDIGPGIALSIPRLSHYPLGPTDLPYEQTGPVPGIVPIPLDRPQPLTKILPPP